MNPLRAAVVTAALVLGFDLVPSVASAQEYLMSGTADIGTGIESGGYGVRRARTRLRFALELRVDEHPDDGFIAAADVDLEPKTGFAGEVRYMHVISPALSVSAGAIGYLVPGTLLGPCAGIEARAPIGKKAYAVIGPEATVFVVGSDLPDNSVVWQALFQVGFRADFF